MQHANKLNFSLNQERLIITIIMGMFPLAGMAIDLVAPSLPAMSLDLHISHTTSKNLITIYLLGSALGNFCVGFLADALGRRKLGILGLLVFTIASLLPALLPNVTVLLCARFLQGLAMGSIIVIARAILSDILPPEKLLRIATLIATMWGIGPIIGPVIGGYLQYYINWQAGFYFLALYSLICLTAMITVIPETHFSRQALNFSQIKLNFLTIVKHRIFMGVVFLMGIASSILIVFNTLGPFLIQIQLGHTPVYFGHIALCMGVAFLLGTMVCRYLVNRYQPEVILSIAIPVFLMLSFSWVIAAYVAEKNIWIIIIPSLFMFFGAGIIYPASMGRGLILFRHLAGSSSAVMNLIRILIASLTGLAMSFITLSSILPMSWIYLGLMLLSGLVYGFLMRNSF